MKGGMLHFGIVTVFMLANVDLSPGTYNITAAIPGSDEASEEIELDADTVWVIMIGPGGLLPLWVY